MNLSLPGGSVIVRSPMAARRHDRLCAALLQISRAALRATTREGLCREVCRSAVTSGGFVFAWIGWRDADSNVIVPAAHHGAPDELLEALTILTDERAEVRGPASIAFRSLKPYVCNDFLCDSLSGPWRSAAERAGIAACAALPIRLHGVVTGMLTIYAREFRCFDALGISLLQDAAADISHGLDVIAPRIARDLAESADRLKSAFLATMSHELRTPLNSILGFTGIVLRGMAGPLTAEQSKQLGMVRSSARHLLVLINDVLDISKIEAGQLEIHARPIDLRALVETVIDTIAPMAAKKGLSVRVKAQPPRDILVSDQRRVEQVLLNLLDNAVKFTERGDIELAVESLSDYHFVGAPAGQRCVSFRVADTGAGIHDGDLHTLFKPFQQIDSGLTRHHEGSGLGLAISRRLAALLGGEILVESRFGVGSTFIFTIPERPSPGQ